MKQQLHHTAEAIESYIEAHLFDSSGLLCSGIDMKTGRPFEREYLTPARFGPRPARDTWAYWTYEDSVMGTGLYIDALVRKYEVTGDSASLQRAHQMWLVARNIYSCSQAFGIGSFLRPYGGYESMIAWAEPLGTDQASPLFSGLYLYSKHADATVRDEIANVLLNTLSWYEQQNFSYFYYKTFMHEWAPGGQHCASFYLPAIAWAARETGEAKWERRLDEKMSLFAQADYVLYRNTGHCSFLWGSDLIILFEILGERFSHYINESELKASYESCLDSLDTHHTEPGMLWRLHPESAEPGFKPFYRSSIEDRNELSGESGYWVHGARLRPWHEIHFLCSLAALRYPGAFEQAEKLLALRSRVPEDFSYYMSEDYEQLPEAVSINARSVGAPWLIEWDAQLLAAARNRKHERHSGFFVR